MTVKPGIQPDRPDTLSDDLIEPLLSCARGSLPPNVALMQLILRAKDVSCVDKAVDAITQSADDQEKARLALIERLWRENSAAFFTLREVASLFDHNKPGENGTSDGQLAVCQAAFNTAAERSPDAGSALYALDNPDLLRSATAEIVQRMQDWRLFDSSSVLLEIGCGGGRLIAALAPLVQKIIGIDISEKMLAAANERCASLDNVRLYRSSGKDLAFCMSSSIDLLYAADSFPYIAQCSGTVLNSHFRDAARILKPGGFFLILNYSYGREQAQDISDLRHIGSHYSLRLIRHATDDFCMWDGRTFLLQRVPG